ncbi:hypothetical protein BDP27DRAFT_1367578 [Rhodocollybia butyracea]|uniref:Uncharacterized protein n=1 Tax=Rhodocollybia butyracea TaxID=206335 RepID=A0A9P5PIE2_9AGAR|nr:hypothetical protein BDP27DRAFT_1367578 [Rhodocollybia butyracea]
MKFNLSLTVVATILGYSVYGVTAAIWSQYTDATCGTSGGSLIANGSCPGGGELCNCIPILGSSVIITDTDGTFCETPVQFGTLECAFDAVDFAGFGECQPAEFPTQSSFTLQCIPN